MQKTILAIALLGLGETTAQAGGLDRSGQDIGLLFQEGNLLEFSLGYTSPSVDGTDIQLTPFNPGGNTPIGNVGGNFFTAGAGVKYEFSDQVSVAFIIDQPYGSDVLYPGNPATTALGGTSAVVNSTAFTALGRYKFNDNWSVHGGLRYQTLSASVSLNGLAFGPLNGYNASFESDGAVGYVVGVAYEIPDIALRVALTYNSAIDHDLRTQERVGAVPVAAPGVTQVQAPESVNLDFQTGIAQDTLLFGSIRWANYDTTLVSPAFFDGSVDPGTPGTSLTDIEDSLDLEIGIGRRFNDKWSGRIAIGYERSDGSLVSPLAPTNGARYVSVGAAYNVNESLTVSGGVRYTRLGDAFPETGTPDVARASFSDNSATSVGLRITHRF